MDAQRANPTTLKEDDLLVLRLVVMLIRIVFAAWRMTAIITRHHAVWSEPVDFLQV